MTDSPFKITVYDKLRARKAIISTPISLRCIPRHNLKGVIEFSLALNHPALADLMQAGSRAVVEYHGKHAVGGPVIARSINGPTIQGSATFMVEDDFRAFYTICGWPVPSSPITNQSAAERYRITGPAETVVKQLFAANAINRLGENYTVATDQGRGDVITVEMRFESLFEKLFPAVEDAGIGVSLKQVGTQIILDCYEPQTYAPLLSEESGIVDDWSWTNNAPKATHAVMGGREEAKLREFRQFSDSTAAALWGFRSETFADVRDVGSELNDWYGDMKTAQGQTPPDDAAIAALNASYPSIRASYEALVAKRGAAVLAENAEKTGIRMVLSETDSFRYGESVNVGDRVSMKVGPSLTLTDMLREAELTWSFEDGVTATPSVGEITDNPDRAFAQALRNSASRIRKIEVK